MGEPARTSVGRAVVASLRLEVDLIPQTAWGQSVKKLHPDVWKRIRLDALERAQGQCELCARTVSVLRAPLEVHERWEWREETKEQRLVGLVAICRDCHSVIHWGRTQNVAPSSLDRLREHWATVNGVPVEQFDASTDEAWDRYHQRSAIEWRLVLGVPE